MSATEVLERPGVKEAGATATGWPGRSLPAWAGVLGFCLACVLAEPGRALDREDGQFVDYLVNDLRYYDTAQRYLEDLKARSRLDKESQAEIDARLIDILERQGRKDAASRALEEFKRKYPDHERSALGDLQAIGAAFYDKVWKKLEEVESQTETAEREKLVKEVSALFERNVRAPLKALIAGLEKTAAESDEMRSRRNRAELTRVRFLLLFADALPRGTVERQKVLEEGLELATFFVENRGTFYVMQYEALIQKGLYLYQLERFEEAGDELEILFDIAPPMEPPFPPETVRAFKELRLKALLFGTRAFNAAGLYQRSVEAIEVSFLGLPKSDPFYLGDAESDPKLKQHAVLLKLEHAVALAGSGKPREGLDIIQSVIEREKASDNEALVNDARQALGRMAAGGDIALSGRDYYQAGLGLKGEGNLEQALGVLNRALAGLSPLEMSEYAPLCLNEIGEVNYMLNRHEESALAFQDICLYFRSSPLITKAATNFVAAATKALESDPKHAGLRELHSQATEISKDFGRAITVVENRMAEANRLIDQGRYLEARKVYLEIPEEVDGSKIDFYWRARASAWWMVLLELDKREDPQLEKQLDQALDELRNILSSALEAKDSAGAAVAALTTGQIHYRRKEWPAAVAALRVFLEDLAGEGFVRCGALGYLADASCSAAGQDIDRKENEGLAVAAFAALQKGCEDDPARSYAALSLSDYFATRTVKGSLERAAVYMKIYAGSPEFQQVLAGQKGPERVETYLTIARRLIDGGLAEDAQKYIQLAKEIPDAGDLERELLYLGGRILYRQRSPDYAAVITELRKYIKKYRASGKELEDDDVWFMLARSYVYVEPRTASNLVKADKAFNNARSILYRRLERLKAIGKKDAKLNKRYWTWFYQWMRVKYILGTKGKSLTALKELVFFIKESMGSDDTEMGGRKEQLLKLKRAAERKLKNGSRSRRKK